MSSNSKLTFVELPDEMLKCPLCDFLVSKSERKKAYNHAFKKHQGQISTKLTKRTCSMEEKKQKSKILSYNRVKKFRLLKKIKSLTGDADLSDENLSSVLQNDPHAYNLFQEQFALEHSIDGSSGRDSKDSRLHNDNRKISADDYDKNLVMTADPTNNKINSSIIIRAFRDLQQSTKRTVSNLMKDNNIFSVKKPKSHGLMVDDKPSSSSSSNVPQLKEEPEESSQDDFKEHSYQQDDSSYSSNLYATTDEHFPSCSTCMSRFKQSSSSFKPSQSSADSFIHSSSSLDAFGNNKLNMENLSKVDQQYKDKISRSAGRSQNEASEVIPDVEMDLICQDLISLFSASDAASSSRAVSRTMSLERIFVVKSTSDTCVFPTVRMEMDCYCDPIGNKDVAEG